MSLVEKVNKHNLYFYAFPNQGDDETTTTTTTTTTIGMLMII